MNLRGKILLLILLFYCVNSLAQQAQYAFKSININDGLSQNSVVDIIEDPTGFMWFATQDGLNRFDGREFLVFPVSFDDVTSPDNVLLGKLFSFENDIYMIKKGGKISVLNLHTQKFTPLHYLGKNKLPLPGASYIYFDSQKGLWIGTLNKGIYHLNNRGEVQHYSVSSPPGMKIISNRVRSVFEDSARNIWVVTDSGITEITPTGFIEHLKGINAHVITQARDKTLWVGTLGSGIFYKKPGAPEFVAFKGYKNKELPEGMVVESILADKDHRIWIGTYGDGLYILDPIKTSITHLLPNRHDPAALSFQDVLALKQDRKGGIWIGTDGGGVNYYNRQFNYFRTIAIHNVDENISIEQIRSIVTDEKGRVWFGTSGQGLTFYDPRRNKFETFHLSPYKPGISNYDRIVSLQLDNDGDLWIGTQGNGLLIMDRTTKEIKKWFTTEAYLNEERIPDNTIWRIIPGQLGQMWLATRNAGLVLLDKQKGVLKNYILPANEQWKNEGRNVQSLIRIDSLNLALGFEQRGVHLLNSKTGKFSPVTGKLIEKTLNRETDIKCLYFEEGWLWIGTGGKGILVTNLETGNTYLIDDKEWLPNNMIYGILPKEKGILWMSSNKGIFRLTYTYDNDKLKLRKILPFTAADGLQSNEFNTGAYHKGKNGFLYFGGISGLTYFKPVEIIYSQNALSVILTNVMVGNTPLQEDTIITYRNNLNLTSKQNSLSFNYTALDYVSPENIQYQYKLEGHDEDWIEAGTRNYTAYTNLAPANYIFKVRVSDKIAVNAPLTSLPISIAVPFWQQWWFILLALLFLLAFIYGLHRYRVYQLLEVEKVKNIISADLHDDLGARLTNIQFLSAISKNKMCEGCQEVKYLNSIEEEVEASAKALDEIVWNIKMKDESLEEILAKMRRYAGEVFEKGYTYKIDIKGDFHKKRMSMQKRRELFLVFKELLNNIRKHAGASRVVVKISIKDGMLFLAVKDNGRGFDPRLESKRNGLRNIKERVKRWEGSMRLRSQKNKGTRVALKIPFDHWFLNFG